MKNTPRKLQSRPLASDNKSTAAAQGMGGGQADMNEGIQVHTVGHEDQNGCTHPCLLLSISRGATARMYVQVQISRSITRRSDWKLKSADYRWLGTDQRGVSMDPFLVW